MKEGLDKKEVRYKLTARTSLFKAITLRGPIPTYIQDDDVTESLHAFTG